jgi:hypothetical protein
MKNQQDIINKLEEIKDKGENKLYDIDFSYLSLEEADRKNFDEITKTILLNSEDYPDQIEFVKENANIEVIKELVHDENLRQNNIFPYVITQLLDNEKENKIGNVLNFIYKDNKPKTQTEINFVKNAINNYIDNKPYKVTAKDIISSVKYFDRATEIIINKADEKILTSVSMYEGNPQSVADYVLSNSNYYAIKKLINKVGLKTISKGFEYGSEKKTHTPFDSHNDYILEQFQKAVKSQKYNEKSYNEDIKIIGKLGKVEDFNNLVKEQDFYKNKKQKYLKNLNNNKPTKLSQLFNGIQEGITHENIKLTAYNKMLLQDVFAEYLKDNAQNIEIDDLKNQDVEKLLQYNVVGDDHIKLIEEQQRQKAEEERKAEEENQRQKAEEEKNFKDDIINGKNNNSVSKTSLFADFSLALFFITAVVAAISLPIINHFVGVGIPFIATSASLGGFLAIEAGAIIGAAGLKGIFAIKENNLLAKSGIKDKSLVKTFFSHYHLDSKVEKLLRERVAQEKLENTHNK